MPSCDLCGNSQLNCYNSYGELTLCNSCLIKVTRFIFKNIKIMKRIILSRNKSNIFPYVLEE